jgi:hypothetical protein
VILTIVLLAILFVAVKYFAGSLLSIPGAIFEKKPPVSTPTPNWWEFWKKDPPWVPSPDKEEVDRRAAKAIVKNLLINGEFKNHWSKGWQKETRFDSDGIVRVEVKDGILSATLACTFCGISQPIAVKGLKDMVFDGRFKLKGIRPEGLGSLLSMAEIAVDISFYQKKNFVGRFWITNQQPSSLEQFSLKLFPQTVQNQKQVRVIPANDQWQRIQLNLYQDVLDYLAVDAESVDGIVISLLAKTSGQEAKAEAWVDYLRLYYKD